MCSTVNKLINILRIIQTQILNRYRQEWSEADRPGSEHHPLTHDLVQLYVYMSTAIMIKKLVETSVIAYTAAVSYILARDVG